MPLSVKKARAPLGDRQCARTEDKNYTRRAQRRGNKGFLFEGYAWALR